MYVSITGNKGNQDVYIKQSYRKENGKTSSRIYKKLGKYNDLLAQFSGDETAMMDWAKKEAEKETLLYNQRREKVTVSFSPLAHWTKSGSSTSAICSCSSSAPICGSTTSAEISVTITGLLTIPMLSLRI
mgnify:CR=1 FL=1